MHEVRDLIKAAMAGMTAVEQIHFLNNVLCWIHFEIEWLENGEEKNA